MRCFRTTVRGEHGSMAQVEISAVSTFDGGRRAVGYAIRNVSSRLDMGLQSTLYYTKPQGIGASAKTGRQLTRSVEQLTELIGRVSLRDPGTSHQKACRAEMLARRKAALDPA